ncbi:MAG: peptide chain release factor 2 [Acholeplasmatales bacterium]|nr:peptide chain release factor 2 [Acholeplasmatales bacterium]
MEKYEVNKFIEESKIRLNDIYEALSIKDKTPLYDKLKEESEKPDFWNDPANAKSVIEKMNSLNKDILGYNKGLTMFNSINESKEFAFDDPSMLDMLTDEIKAFEKYLEELENKTLLAGKYDFNNCIIEFHPGAGGTESMDWAQMLFRMYQRFAQRMNYKFEIISYEMGDEAGIKSASAIISGEYAYGMLKSEKGVHRLVRISPFDSNKRRHTSFCSIDVTPEIEESDEITIKDEDIRIDTYLSSGHGGQGVNTTYSAVRVTHLATGIVVTCQNERSQLKNKDICLKILKSKLLELEYKKREAEMKNLKGEHTNINFGSQIRSYVFTPYTLVKDHRTDYEVGNVNQVMDGDLEGFMYSYLKQLAGNK